MSLTTFNWLQLIGIPALTALLVGLLFRKLDEKIHQNEVETDAIKKGVQALLRSQLYTCYHLATEKGFATIEDRNNFENLYRQYHALDVNGVMDDVRHKFMNLPTERK